MEPLVIIGIITAVYGGIETYKDLKPDFITGINSFHRATQMIMPLLKRKKGNSAQRTNRQYQGAKIYWGNNAQHFTSLTQARAGRY